LKLLLDTHIWISNEVEPWKLSSEVQRELANPSNELWVSPVSIREIVVLLEKRRIDLKQDFGQWVEGSIRDLQLNEAFLTLEAAQELRFTMLGYRDLADRFLVATTKVYDLTLVTADERLQRIPGIQVLANR